MRRKEGDREERGRDGEDVCKTEKRGCINSRVKVIGADGETGAGVCLCVHVCVGIGQLKATVTLAVR